MQPRLAGIIHYAIGSVVIGFYGIAVCPFIAELAAHQIALPIVVSFVIGYGLRTLLRSKLLGEYTDPRQLIRVFAIEFTSIIAIGLLYTAYNALVFSFPALSAAKVLVGVATLACFAATDVALRYEYQAGEYFKANGISVNDHAMRTSFSTRLLLVTLFSITVLTSVLLLVFAKEVYYLEQLGSVAELTGMHQAVMKEAYFVTAVIMGYLLLVMKDSSRMLKFYLNNQRETLEQVARGELASSVPVISNNEFGDIARHTNTMLRTLEQRNLELQRTQDAAILSLATLAETRDNETGAHIMRTKEYVTVLIHYLATQPEFAEQLSASAIDIICKSVPLHDIGKVGIPDNVLLKPGKLTDEEYTIMKTHSMLGVKALEAVEQVLGTSHFLSCAKDVVATHHERWDGKGYPAGLTGNETPLSGRLMAVADVYDALISARVYKPAFSHERAAGIILEGRGSQFDPVIVDAFEACEDAFRRISAQYADEAEAGKLAA